MPVGATEAAGCCLQARKSSAGGSARGDVPAVVLHGLPARNGTLTEELCHELRMCCDREGIVRWCSIIKEKLPVGRCSDGGA